MTKLDLTYNNLLIASMNPNTDSIMLDTANKCLEYDIETKLTVDKFEGEIITGISVTSPPTKTEYAVDEVTIDTTGLVVTANYIDGRSRDITSECIITADNMKDGKLTSYTTKIDKIKYGSFEINCNYPISVIGECLTLTAEEPNCSIYFKQNGNPSTTKNFYYSLDRIIWTPFSFEKNGDLLSIDLNYKGDKLYIKGDNNTTISESSSIYMQFNLFGQFSSSGNTNTLISANEKITNISHHCFYKLFRKEVGYLNSGLINIPELPATTISNYCYSSMFEGNKYLVDASIILPATTLADSCYAYMFKTCNGLVAAPQINAITLAYECFRGMFVNCTELITSPVLLATTLDDNCYENMFNGCSKLINPPELLAKTLKNNCYYCMFMNCTSLVTPPALPATTLAESCYYGMFMNCVSLVTPPALPATTLAINCYWNMFNGCTSLTTAPALPATALEDSCYSGMFNGCKSLTTAPNLPATILVNSCYDYMFSSCTSLTKIPKLPATTLADSCYYYMFAYCTSLYVSETQSAEASQAWIIPTNGLGQGDFTMDYMFTGCLGTRESGDSPNFNGIQKTYYTQNTPV